MNNYEIIEKSQSKPILLDFWATWCAPCKSLGIILNNIVQTDNRFELIKVNVDEESDLTAQYNITSVPTLKLIKYGNLVNELIGLQSQKNLQNWLDKNL